MNYQRQILANEASRVINLAYPAESTEFLVWKGFVNCYLLGKGLNYGDAAEISESDYIRDRWCFFVLTP